MCNHFQPSVCPEGAYVICVKNLYQSYYEGKPVLSNVSLHVEQGTIYGLLGSSGCGKTSLLSCILGFRKWESGQVFIFGIPINNSGSGAKHICRSIGYMPQELSLNDQLTVKETIYCYAGLYGMERENVVDKCEVLSNLLNLTSFLHRLISTLSGGQKRRVSLALALVHSPPLLILDEPTVGLDPLLRVSIWKHLHHLASSQNVTILVTTHYVEEVKQSNRVGVMRNGRMIAEQNPLVLMQLYETSLLEHAVRRLCHTDQFPSNSSLPASNVMVNTSSSNQLSPVSNSNFSSVHTTKGLNLRPSSKTKYTTSNAESTSVCKSLYLSAKRTKVYTYYVAIAVLRHAELMSIIIFLPLLQLLTTLSVVGTNPVNIPFGIVKADQVDKDHLCVWNVNRCDLSSISCQLIHHLSCDKVLELIDFNTGEMAEKAVEQGVIWGYIRFPANFSQNIVDRAALKAFADNETIDGALIQFRMDMSDVVVNHVVLAKLEKSFYDLIDSIEKTCGLDLSLYQYPVEHKEPPIYGQSNSTPREYAMPALVTVLILEVALAFSPLALLNEYDKGTLARARVAGLCLAEAMTSILIVSVAFALIQSTLSYFCLIYILKFGIQGSFIDYIGICFVGALCGIAFSILVGLLIKDSVSCIICTILVFSFIVIHMGLFRPMESLPYTIRHVTYYFPLVAVVDPLRSILNRGVNIIHPTVWPGVLLTFMWFIVLWIVCLLIRRRLLS